MRWSKEAPASSAMGEVSSDAAQRSSSSSPSGIWMASSEEFQRQVSGMKEQAISPEKGRASSDSAAEGKTRSASDRCKERSGWG